MNRRTLALALALLAALVALFLLDPFGSASGPRPEKAVDDPSTTGAPPPAVLDGTSASTSSGREAGTPSPPATEAPLEIPAPPAVAGAVAGVVVDAATGKPVAGASVAAHAHVVEKDAAEEGRVPFATAGTAADGTFRVDLGGAAEADVVARADGYGDREVLAARAGTTVVIRLAKGRTIEVVVRSKAGALLAGATVVVGTMARSVRGEPETVARTRTDANGKARVSGLEAETHRVLADHPTCISSALLLDPDTGPMNLTLLPALSTTFAVRGRDGTAIEAATIEYRLGDAARRRGSFALEARGGGRFGPHKFACDAPSVDLTLHATGFLPWEARAEPLPPEGGTRHYDVVLERDFTVGDLVVTFEDADRKPVSYAGSGLEVVVTHVNGKEGDPKPVHEAGEAWRLRGAREGDYQLFVSGPLFVPTSLRTRVTAQRENSERVALRPTARLHVKVEAGAGRRARFQVKRNGRQVRAWFLDAKGHVDSGPRETSFLAGAEGVTLVGLPGSAHVVEIVSPDLKGEPVEVVLAEGETREAVLRASPK